MGHEISNSRGRFPSAQQRSKNCDRKIHKNFLSAKFAGSSEKLVRTSSNFAEGLVWSSPNGSQLEENFEIPLRAHQPAENVRGWGSHGFGGDQPKPTETPALLVWRSSDIKRRQKRQDDSWLNRRQWWQSENFWKFSNARKSSMIGGS